MAALIEWLKERPTHVPPRWATILMWTLIVATPTAAILRAGFDARAEARLRCEQRVDSREQIRGAFIDVYALITELSPGSEFATAARLRLDATYPPLSIADC